MPAVIDALVVAHRHALGGRLVGGDGVDPDAVGRELERQRAREVGDRALHARVDRVPRRGAVTLDRRDADDAAAVPLLLHLVRGEVGGVQQPAEVRADDRVPPAHVGVGEVGLERAAGDVDERVELAEAVEPVGEGLAHRVGVAHVDDDGERLLTGRGRDVGGGGAQQLLVLVEQHEVHARLGEVGRHGASESTAAPGDQRDLALQSCSFLEISHAGIIAHNRRARAPVEGQLRGRKRSRVMPRHHQALRGRTPGATGMPTAIASGSTSTSVVETRTPSASSTIASSCGTSSANGGAVGCSATVNVYTVPTPSTVVHVSRSDRHAGQRERG